MMHMWGWAIDQQERKKLQIPRGMPGGGGGGGEHGYMSN